MSRLLLELENILQSLIEEHRKLSAHVSVQQNAMKTLQIEVMQDAMHRQESTRLRIVSLDNRRRQLVQQIAKLMRVNGDVTIMQIAAAFPQNGTKLLQLRDELKQQVKQLADLAHVAGRLAAAVLGHLNTAMRLFASAVGQAGIYTKHGTPRVATRIGVMDAVG